MTEQHTRSQRNRTWGFRFSHSDGVVLCGTFVSAAVSWNHSVEFSALLLFVVLHFFLFCNVFRIRRAPELIWAAVLLVNCYVWAAFHSWPMLAIGCLQTVFTVGILAWEISRPCYHGIFAQSWNSDLELYLNGE